MQNKFYNPHSFWSLPGEHFGFAESEVDDILNQAHLLEKSTEIKRACNRYKVDETVIYNPVFIAHCVKNGGYTSPYWINASDHQLIKNLLQQSSLGFKIQLANLMYGETIEILSRVNVIFSDLKQDSSVVWSILLMSGYLTSIASSETYQGISSKVDYS